MQAVLPATSKNIWVHKALNITSSFHVHLWINGSLGMQWWRLQNIFQSWQSLWQTIMHRKALECLIICPPYFAPLSINLFNTMPIPEVNKQAKGMEKAKHPAKRLGNPPNNTRFPLNQLPDRINKPEPFFNRISVVSCTRKCSPGAITYVAPTCRSLRKAGVNW